MGASAGTALVVEDDVRSSRYVDRALRREGLAVHHACSYAEAMSALDESTPDYAVLDLMLPDGHGLDLIGHVKTAAPHSRIILVTGFGSVSSAVEAIRMGASDYLLKPIDLAELIAALKQDAKDDAPKKGVELPTLDRAQWEYIQRVLAYCGGNISQAARHLGMHRQSLQRILRRNPPRK